MRAMDGTRRQDIRPGLTVEIILKQDQTTGKRTRGIVKEILTPRRRIRAASKLPLTSGVVGRVKAIVS